MRLHEPFNLQYNKVKESRKDKGIYQLRIVARRLRKHQDYETGQEAGGFELGSNQLIVNVRGPYCLGYEDADGYFMLGHWSTGFIPQPPIIVRGGSNIKKDIPVMGLEELVNDIGEKHRRTGLGYDFIEEVFLGIDQRISDYKQNNMPATKEQQIA